MNPNFASSAKPSSQLELSANLLTGWRADRIAATQIAKRNVAITLVSSLLAVATLTTSTVINSSASAKVDELDSSIAASGGEVDPEDAPIDGFIAAEAPQATNYSPETQLIINQARDENKQLLIQFGNSLSQTRKTLTLESIEADFIDNNVAVRGTAIANEIGFANAYTARLTANNPGARAYLTNVERNPETGSTAIRLSFELVTGAIQ